MDLPGVGTPKARQASLREHNLALVARSVFGAAEPPSRAAVAAATGLTRATVGSLVDQLVAGRIVAELAPSPGQVGRPAVPLAPARRTVVGLGLEVNVDYVGVRALDLSGATVAERIVATPDVADPDGSGGAGDPARVLSRVGDLAREVVAEVEAGGMRLAGARLALPGLVDARAGFLQVAPNLGWASLAPVPLLGSLPARVEIANEANLAGLAQLPFGQFAASGHDGTTFVHVSGDVGIGAAIVLDGELYLGRHGWAGEIGHVVVDPAGPRCRCGATGCLEQLAGKDALLRGLGLDVPRPGAPWPAGSRPDGAPSDGLAPVAEALAAGGEVGARARDVVGRAGKALGTALSTLVNLLDLDTVLLGGVYAALVEDLRPSLEAELRTRVLASPWERIAVRPAPVAGYAALTGGARAVLRDLVQAPSDYLETLESPETTRAPK